MVKGDKKGFLKMDNIMLKGDNRILKGNKKDEGRQQNIEAFGLNGDNGASERQQSFR